MGRGRIWLIDPNHDESLLFAKELLKERKSEEPHKIGNRWKK